MTLVTLPRELHARILREAADAAPRECCGLLEGTSDEDGFRITALHPARNLALSPDRFELDPQDHFAALKPARANGHRLIGCYHSHPNGSCEPSSADRAGAGEENFLWLIEGNGQLNAFVYADGGFAPLDWA